VDNLPKVVTQNCLEQDLTPRPTDRKPKCLTRCTTPATYYSVTLVFFIVSGALREQHLNKRKEDFENLFLDKN